MSAYPGLSQKKGCGAFRITLIVYGTLFGALALAVIAIEKPFEALKNAHSRAKKRLGTIKGRIDEIDDADDVAWLSQRDHNVRQLRTCR